MPVHFLLYSVIWTIFARHFDFIPVQMTGAQVAGLHGRNKSIIVELKELFVLNGTFITFSGGSHH